MDAHSLRDMENVLLQISFYDNRDALLAEWNSRHLGVKLDLTAGDNRFETSIGLLTFLPGAYAIHITLTDAQGYVTLVQSVKRQHLIVHGPLAGSVPIQL